MKISTLNAWQRPWPAAVRGFMLVSMVFMAGAAAADNTPATARPLGDNPAQFTTRDVVGATDTVDFYRFRLTTKRSVQVVLSELSGDADLYLYGDNGVWLYSKRRGSGLQESIRKDLDPGEYRIQVYGWAGSINYKLNLRTWVPSPTRGLSRTLPPLDGMGGLNTTVNASGTITPNIGWIDYHFTLPDTRMVTVQGPTNVGAGVTPNTTPVRWKILQNGRLQTTLAAGPHYLRVFRNATQSVSFNFRITAQTPNTNDTAGNRIQAARFIGTPGNPPISLREYVGRYDFDDYFRVSVIRNSTLNVALSHRSGQNANVWVYDASFREVGRSSNLGRANENVSVNAPVGGTYYVRVGIATRNAPNWEHANYTLAVGTQPIRVASPPRPTPTLPRDASNNLGTATPFAGLGRIIGPGAQTQSETVGGAADPRDIYYFNIGCNVSVRQVPGFTVSPAGNVNVQLYRNVNGRPVAQPFVPGRILTPPYQFGRSSYPYYLVVTSRNGAPTSYSVSIQYRGCYSP